MLKPDLIRAVSEETGYSQGVVRDVLDSMSEVVKDCASRGQAVMLAGLGRLHFRRRAERLARNPQTGEPVVAREKIRAVLKPSLSLAAAAAVGEA